MCMCMQVHVHVCACACECVCVGGGGGGGGGGVQSCQNHRHGDICSLHLQNYHNVVSKK